MKGMYHVMRSDNSQETAAVRLCGHKSRLCTSGTAHPNDNIEVAAAACHVCYTVSRCGTDRELPFWLRWRAAACRPV